MTSGFLRVFGSFRNQLFGLFSAGVIAFALIAGISMAIMTSNQVRKLLMDEGEQVVESLAKQSVLALLYGSKENAELAVRTAMAFPAVDYVAIHDAKNAALLERGEPGNAVDSVEMGRVNSSGEAVMVEETGDAWYFAASVLLPESDFEALETSVSPGKRDLGYVLLRMDKRALQEMQFSMMFNHVAVGVTVMLFLLMLLHLSMKRMFRPLERLVRAMQQSQEGEHKTVNVPGRPIEVNRMASVYNSMIGALAERDKALRKSNEVLENQVAIRTQELVHARDTALEANRHKSEFLANMSHELRTPLQSIIGYSDVIREGMEDNALDEYIDDNQRIVSNANHLLELINDILDLAKIEAGKQELNPEPVDMKSVVEQACDTVMPIMKGNENEFSMDLSSDAAPVLLDRGKLYQVMLNLLSNAAKFTRQGKVCVKVTRLKNTVEIAIEDTGIGVDPGLQKYIFEPFRQADGSATRQYQGTGLGLAITRQYVELMGREIRLESELGKGSKFMISLPVRQTVQTGVNHNKKIS